MSYSEYYDIFEAAQKRDCPFVAYFVDVVDSKKNFIGKGSILAHNDFVNKLTFALKDKLKIDKKNILYFRGSSKNMLIDLNNPMIIGDGTCYFFKKGKITQAEFEKILIKTLKETNYPFDLHLSTCYYETDDYDKGDTKLYKGYVFRLLEDQKHSGIIINKNSQIEDENE